jgi:lipopolysaccharide/colanic/teichoic acid biosynthesis glycosyltransferase
MSEYRQVRPLVDSGLRRLLINLHDLGVTTLAFPAAFLLRENFHFTPHHIQPLLIGSLLVLLTASVVFRLTGLQRMMWRYTSSHDLLLVAKSVTLILAVIVPMMFLFDRLTGVPRSIILIFWLVAFVGLSGSRIVYGCLKASKPAAVSAQRDHIAMRALVVGDIPSAAAIIQRVHAMHSGRVKIVGVLSETEGTGRSIHGVAILGSMNEIKHAAALLEVQGLVPQILIGADFVVDDERLQKVAHAYCMRLVAAKGLEDLDLINMATNTRQQLFRDRSEVAPYHTIKRFVEAGLALSALIIALPLLLTISLVSLMTLGAPVLFDQFRAGLRLHEFSLLKFRTMYNRFDQSGRMVNDAERLSNFGSFLRATRLDELPQFWNIVIGDMALIGPRPLLSRDLPTDPAVLKERYSVRPGLTGWAQVNGGQLLSNEQKIALDLYYIRNSSFAFDLKILLLTLRTVLLGERVNPEAIERAKLVTAAA